MRQNNWHRILKQFDYYIKKFNSLYQKTIENQKQITDQEKYPIFKKFKNNIEIYTSYIEVDSQSILEKLTKIFEKYSFARLVSVRLNIFVNEAIKIAVLNNQEIIEIEQKVIYGVIVTTLQPLIKNIIKLGFKDECTLCNFDPSIIPNHHKNQIEYIIESTAENLTLSSLHNYISILKIIFKSMETKEEIKVPENKEDMAVSYMLGIYIAKNYIQFRLENLYS